jgi:hypothetical protein
MIYKTKGTCSTSIDVELKDGVIDSVKFTVVQDKDGNVTVKFNINGKESTDELGPLGLDESCVHVGDTVVGDGYTELYVTGDAASDDYVTFVYRVHNGELKKAFITGTGLGSNIMFAQMHIDAAASLGMNPITVFAGQNAGASLGNLICPNNTVAACATVDQVGNESEVMKKTFKAFAIILVLYMALAMLYTCVLFPHFGA